jgi:sodium/bile acid cotransporter 7
MGVPLTTVLFLGIDLVNESKIQIPMVIFQGFQIFQGSLLTIVFRRWIQAKEDLEAGKKSAAEVEAEKEGASAEKAYQNEPRAADNS